MDKMFHFVPHAVALWFYCLWRCGDGTSRSARGAQCHAAPLRGALRSHGCAVFPKPPPLAVELHSAGTNRGERNHEERAQDGEAPSRPQEACFMQISLPVSDTKTRDGQCAHRICARQTRSFPIT